MPKRAVLYARVSSDDTKNEGRNLKGQLDMCREYAESNGWLIVAELAEDDRGARGASFDLPQLSKLREMAKASEFDILVVREIDRLSRKLSKQLVVEDELQRHGVQIEYVLGEYPDTPEGNLLKHVKATIAEYEREKIKERMTRGRRLKAKSGQVVLHGRAPYGYRKVECDGKTKLEIHEQEATVVRLIFALYTEGDEHGRRMSMGKIVKQLTEMEIPTFADKNDLNVPKERGWGEWNRTTIRNMITNETYAGVWHYGKRNGGDGTGSNLNPKEDWIEVSVPAIVSRSVWDAAQERIEYNKRHARRNMKYDYLLSKRLTCGDCGSSIRASSKTASGKLYLYYRCQAKTQYANSDCSMQRHFRADKLDDMVWKWVKSFLTDKESLQRGLQAYQSNSKQIQAALRERLELVEQQLEALSRRKERLLRVYLAEEIDQDMWSEHKTEIESKISSLERDKKSMTAQIEKEGVPESTIRAIEEFADEVAQGLDAADDDFETRRRVIEKMQVCGSLAIEDGKRVAHMQCLLGEAYLSVASNSFRTVSAPNR